MIERSDCRISLRLLIAVEASIFIVLDTDSRPKYVLVTATLVTEEDVRESC